MRTYLLARHTNVFSLNDRGTYSFTFKSFKRQVGNTRPCFRLNFQPLLRVLYPGLWAFQVKTYSYENGHIYRLSSKLKPGFHIIATITAIAQKLNSAIVPVSIKSL